MRLMFTNARRHDGEWVLALGPDSPRKEHRALRKAVRVSRCHPLYAEVAECTPTRVTRRIQPAPSSPPGTIQRLKLAAKRILSAVPMGEAAPAKAQPPSGTPPPSPAEPAVAPKQPPAPPAPQGPVAPLRQGKTAAQRLREAALAKHAKAQKGAKP